MGLEEEMMIVARTGENGGVWKMIARSDNEALGEASKCLDFGRGPASVVSGLACSMTVPFLSKEVLPFNVKTRGKLPSV